MTSSCAGQAWVGRTPYPATLLAPNETIRVWVWDSTEKPKQNAMNSRSGRAENNRRSGIRNNLFILRGEQFGVYQRSRGAAGSPVDSMRSTRLVNLLEPKCFEAKMFRSWRSVQLWKFGTKRVGSDKRWSLPLALEAAQTRAKHMFEIQFLRS